MRSRRLLFSCLSVLLCVGDGQGQETGTTCLDPSDVAAADEMLALAECLTAEKRLEDAFDAYRAAYEFDRTSVAAMTGMGIVLNLVGRPEAAIASLSRALNLEPTDFGTRVEIAKSLQLMNRFDASESLLRELVLERPSAVEVHRLLGNLLYQNGYFGGALREFDAVLLTLPGDLESLVRRAACLGEMGRLTESQKAFEELFEKGVVPNGEAAYSFARLLLHLGRSQKALQILDGASESETDAPAARLLRARILRSLGRVEAAIEELRKALLAQPESIEGHAMLMRSYLDAGRHAEAAAEAAWIRRREAERIGARP